MTSLKMLYVAVSSLMIAHGELELPKPLPDTFTFIDHVYQGNRFEGLNVVVFGGTSGIGFASAAMFMQECAAHTAIVGRNAKQGKVAVEVLRNISSAHCSQTGKIEYLRADVTKRSEVRRVFDAFQSKARLEVVVNTAGVGGWSGNLADLPEDSLFSSHDAVFNNVYGAVHVQSEALRFWGKQGCNPLGVPACPDLSYVPALVQTSSEQGMAPGGLIDMYSASKHAIIGLTTSTAQAFTAQLRANVVLPALVDTPFTWNQVRGYELVNNTLPDTPQHDIQTFWQCVVDGRVIEDGACPGGGTGYGCPCEDVRKNDTRLIALYRKINVRPINPRRVGVAVLDLADPTSTATGTSVVVGFKEERQCTESLFVNPLWDSCPPFQRQRSAGFVV